MLLAVDIGNTNIVLGLFKGSKLISRQRIISSTKPAFRCRAGVDEALISSVVPGLNMSVSNAVNKAYGIKPKVLSWRDIGDIKITLRNKAAIGIDRLVNAVAAYKMHGGPVIIVDFGTATTFCAIDKKGKYLGGAITSGLAISRDVLHERTAKLPFIKLKVPNKVVGGDTLQAMRSGLFYGYVDMVEGMIKRFRREIGRNAKVVATGGLSKLISKGTRMFDVVDPDLTLKGLNIIARSIK